MLLAANHVSFLDPLLVAWPLFRPVRFLAMKPLFHNRAFGWFIRSGGAIPIDSLRGADKQGYSAGLRVLQSGGVLCVFPEGGRSIAGKLHPLKPGVVRLSRAAQVPIVPVRINGAFEVWPRSRRFPRPFGRISLEYRPPIPPPPPDENGEELNTRLEELTRRLQPSFLEGGGPREAEAANARAQSADHRQDTGTE